MYCQRIVCCFLLCAVLIAAGCSNNDEENVAAAMSALDAWQEEVGQASAESKTEHLIAWRAIDVSETPADFQIAWSEAYSAWKPLLTAGAYYTASDAQDAVDMATELFDVLQQKMDHLEIIAASYVPAIKEKLAERAARMREMSEMMNAED